MFKTCLYGNGDIMTFFKVEEKVAAMSKVFDKALETISGRKASGVDYLSVLANNYDTFTTNVIASDSITIESFGTTYKADEDVICTPKSNNESTFLADLNTCAAGVPYNPYFWSHSDCATSKTCVNSEAKVGNAACTT